MRKLTALPVAAVMAFGAVGIAQAVDPAQTVDVKTTSKSIKGEKAFKNATLAVTTTTTPKQGEAPFAVQRAVIHFDKALDFKFTKNYDGCTLAAVEGNTCSSGAKIGSGSARALAGGAGGQPVDDIKVTAYNGKNGKTVYLLVTEKAFSINKALVGTLKNDIGKFGKKLDLVIPATLQNVAGLSITLTEFKTKINKIAGKKPYVALRKCTDKSLDFKGDFFYSDGTRKTATDKQSC